MSNNKELYQQKLQSQLDEWKAEILKLKAKASGLSADAQIKMHQEFDNLQIKLDDGKNELSRLIVTGEDSWESMKTNIESTWNSLKASFHEASVKSKNK